MSDEALVRSQHMAWISLYVRAMDENNWRDMRLRLIRQLDAIDTPNAAPIAGNGWDALCADQPAKCNHWPGQPRCQVCGMGITPVAGHQQGQTK